MMIKIKQQKKKERKKKGKVDWIVVHSYCSKQCMSAGLNSLEKEAAIDMATLANVIASYMVIAPLSYALLSE